MAQEGRIFLGNTCVFNGVNTGQKDPINAETNTFKNQGSTFNTTKYNHPVC